MLKSEEKQIIKCFKLEVKKALGERLDRVVLFGSRARGEAEPDSDFDFLVTVQRLEKQDRNRVREIASDLSLERDTVITVLLLPTEDFREDRYFFLYEHIQKEGQVV
jgi:predicted nucleotidyltransferase